MSMVTIVTVTFSGYGRGRWEGCEAIRLPDEIHAPRPPAQAISHDPSFLFYFYFIFLRLSPHDRLQDCRGFLWVVSGRDPQLFSWHQR